jgi:hypothetical protein
MNITRGPERRQIGFLMASPDLAAFDVLGAEMRKAGVPEDAKLDIDNNGESITVVASWEIPYTEEPEF